LGIGEFELLCIVILVLDVDVARILIVVFLVLEVVPAAVSASHHRQTSTMTERVHALLLIRLLHKILVV
jgi:hypothetical protein